MSIFSYLVEHHAALGSVASIATLIVWLTYLQLFYRSHKHQLESKIMITRAGGRTLSARCMLTNLSPETVYIQAVIIRARFSSRTIECSLSDQELENREGFDPRSNFLQGPLGSGEYLTIGSFGDMITASMASNDMTCPMDDLEEMAVTAVGTYTWNDKMMAAERNYRVACEMGRYKLIADRLMTTQIRSRRRIKKLVAFLEQQSCRITAEPRFGLDRRRGSE